MKHPHFIELWHKPSYTNSVEEKTYDQTNGIVPEQALLTIGKPIKLLQINGSLTLYNSLVSISPNASYFAVFNESGLKVFSINSEKILQLLCDNLSNIKNNNSDLISKIWDSCENLNNQSGSLESIEQMDVDNNEKVEIENNNSFTVTALLATNEYLYFAESDFKIWRLNLKLKKKRNCLVQLANRSILIFN